MSIEEVNLSLIEAKKNLEINKKSQFEFINCFLSKIILENTTISYGLNKSSITVNYYIHSIERGISFQIYFNLCEIKIKNIIDIIKKDSQPSIIDVKEISSVISQFYSFNEEMLQKNTDIIKSLSKDIERISDDIFSLEYKLKILNLQQEISIIDRIIPTLNSFSIEKYITDFFNIPFDEKSIKNDLKKYIMSNNENKSFEFVIRDLTKISYRDVISFKLVKVVLNYITGEFYLYHHYKKINSVKEINKILSQQCSFKNQLITKSNAITDNNLFQNGNYLTLQEYWRSQNISATFNIYEFSGKLKPFLIQNNISYF